MLPRSRPQSLGAQLVDLVLVQLSNWRWAWPQLVLVGLITPFLSMVALSTFASRGLHAQILVGTLVLALLFQAQNQVAANFAFMKANGTLDFFAAQPVRRTLVPIATVSAFLLLSLPALIATVIVGSLLLHVHLAPSPLLVLVVPLAVIPAAAIGALIGSLTNSIEETAAISMIVTFVMTGLGPILLPPARLPEIVKALAYANPATYIAWALHRTLGAEPHIGLGIAVDMAVLAAFAAGTLALVVWKMPWRAR